MATVHQTIAPRYDSALDGTALKTLASARGLLFGSAVRTPELAGDAPYSALLEAQVSQVTAEGAMKMRDLRPTISTFDYTVADELVTWAQARSIEIYGHAHIWHASMPTWESEINAGNAESVIEAHIDGVQTHFAGDCRVWDVVNEAIETGDGRPDGLRVSPWLTWLGPDYIDIAFLQADATRTATGDTGLKLAYNDYDLAYGYYYHAARREKLLDLVSGMQTRGVPIDVIGVQAHLRGDQPPDFRDFRDFLDDIDALGLEVAITEFDVRRTPAQDPARYDQIVADVYREFFAVALEASNLTSVSCWGITDRYTWLTQFFVPPGNPPIRPLPYDDQLAPKAARDALAQALS